MRDSGSQSQPGTCKAASDGTFYRGWIIACRVIACQEKVGKRRALLRPLEIGQAGKSGALFCNDLMPKRGREMRKCAGNLANDGFRQCFLRDLLMRAFGADYHRHQPRLSVEAAAIQDPLCVTATKSDHREGQVNGFRILYVHGINGLVHVTFALAGSFGQRRQCFDQLGQAKGRYRGNHMGEMLRLAGARRPAAPALSATRPSRRNRSAR